MSHEMTNERNSSCDAYVEDGKIVFVRQAIIDRDQAYFWTPEWPAAEREANEDTASRFNGKTM